ncbi:MAG TPA: NAD(P)/FAD-dependent oxidoreductase [Usitatibacter sp.]|jgi:phytoene dehydrogenase-like protein|nr:NAD(P)/FAD-dependent oxidoreductase [Usitatibacter sp.]
MRDRYDVVVVGGGHNGLVCASYLAARRLSVLVLERRAVVGGAAVTEEFHPGFRNSLASYTVSLLHPKVIRDLRLAEHGLRVVERPYSNFVPLADGQALRVGGGLEATQREVARFSMRDAGQLAGYYERLEAVADVLRGLLLVTPPNVEGGVTEMLAAWKASRPFARLTLAQKRDVLDLFTLSAAEWLERWFESDPIKACFGFDSVVGNFASPYAPGTAYVLLHHVFGEVNGRKGQWGHAIGGMGAITQAMRKEAQARGVEVVTDAPVTGITNARGRASGVVLEDGREVAARCVVCNAHPRILASLLGEALGAAREGFEHYQSESATFRMNVALSELPDFVAAPGTTAQPHHSSGIIMAPSLAFMDRAHASAREDGWSREPIVEMLIPSTVDDSLAPAGQHVASLFCQHFRYKLPGTRDWAHERERAADAVIDQVTRFAPNFRSAVVARRILSPADLERELGLVGGDIFHGKLSLNQLFSARPVLGYGNYRMPLRGVYLCGSGAHPGGGVTGIPGHNAAREVLRDRAWR